MTLQLDDLVTYAEMGYEVTIKNTAKSVIIAVECKRHGQTFGTEERFTARMATTTEISANIVIEQMIEKCARLITMYALAHPDEVRE